MLEESRFFGNFDYFPIVVIRDQCSNARVEQRITSAIPTCRFVNPESPESIVMFLPRSTYARWTVSMFTAASDAL
jgi:hypothetical protein